MVTLNKIEVQEQLHNTSGHSTPHSEQEDFESDTTASSDTESSEKCASSESEENPNVALPAPLCRSTRPQRPPDWYVMVVSFQDEDSN